MYDIHMARKRKTVSFKDNVHGYVDNERGKKSFSTYINDHFEEEIDLKEKKKRKKFKNPILKK